MVSIVYWALVGKAEAHDFTEADNVRWFPEDELPELAFDHRQIIDYALWRLRNKIEYPDIATKLVGDTFTLRQLHHVYEAITGEAIDVANFRRRMLLSGELEDTGEKLRDGRHRPAAVYRYNPDRSRASTAPPVGAGAPARRPATRRADHRGAGGPAHRGRAVRVDAIGTRMTGGGRQDPRPCRITAY